jgi:hypothetical protein
MEDHSKLRRRRTYSATSHSTPDSETHNSPRKSHTGGRNTGRLGITGQKVSEPSINIIVSTQGGNSAYSGDSSKKKSKKRRRQTKPEKKRMPVNEGGVEAKLQIRDQARDCNNRVEVALTQFNQLLNKDHYRLQGRHAGTGSSYKVLEQIKNETSVLTVNLDRIGWERDEVMEDLGNWMADRSGEAASMDAQLRNQLLDSQERATELVKESISDMVSRMELVSETSSALHKIFDRTVETAAREIKEGVKKGAEIAVAYEKEKMVASRRAMKRALHENEERNKDGEPASDDNNAVTKANEALKAQPDPEVLSFIAKFKACRDRMRKAEGQIRKFELASFASQDKFNRATEEWEELKKKMSAKIKESQDALRLAEKKLERAHMKAREKEVRDRKQNETTSFIEKKSKRKGTEMLKMQIITLKTRVQELEQEVDSTENKMEELRMEIRDLQEKLESTKDMVTRAEYDDIKRQLFEASDLVTDARAETVAAQKDTADAKAETEKAYEEKAMVLDQLAKAKAKISEQDAEIAKLNIAVEQAAEEKKRALAQQKAEYEKLLEEEKEKTEIQRKRAQEAEEAAEKMQDRIDELDQQIIEIKEVHKEEMEALREEQRLFVENLRAEHEEEKRRMEKQFAAAKKILEDKISRFEEDMNMIKTSTAEIISAALNEFKLETAQLTKTAVLLYGRSERLRKLAEVGLRPPDQENVTLTETVVSLLVGSAIDLSEVSCDDVTNLAETSSNLRLNTAYMNILNVAARTEAYDQGLLDYIHFVNGKLSEDLVSNLSDQNENAVKLFYEKHSAIAMNSDEIRKSQLPNSPDDKIDAVTLIDCRTNATKKRLAQRKAREGAAKRQGETLLALKQCLVEESKRCEEARDTLCKLDVECGKVQYYLETGGLEEGSPSLSQVLESLRSCRVNSTTVADMALLGPNVLITHPSISLDLVQSTSQAFSSVIRNFRNLKIAIIENGAGTDGGEPHVVKEVRQKILDCSDNLQKKRKELAIAAELESSEIEQLINLVFEIQKDEASLISYGSSMQEMQETLESNEARTSDNRNGILEILVDASKEQSNGRVKYRDKMLAEQEGAMLEKVETLEAALELSSQVYENLRSHTQSLRCELAKAESLKGRLCDFIGSSGQLGDQDKLIEQVRNTRSSWVDEAIGVGIELSGISNKVAEQMVTVFGDIEDWINSNSNPGCEQSIHQEDANRTLIYVNKLKNQKIELLKKHVVENPELADGGENTLVPLLVKQIDTFCQLLEVRIGAVIHPNNEELTSKVIELQKELKSTNQEVFIMWKTTQQSYYNTFTNEETEKLLEQLKQAKIEIKKLTEDLQNTMTEKEQALADALEANKALEDAQNVKAPSSRGSSRKSRASSRGVSRGSFGVLSGAMELKQAEEQSQQYSLMAKTVINLCGITERLRSVAPPMHKQNVQTIPNSVAELSAGILQQRSMLQSIAKGDEYDSALLDVINVIDVSASKYMMNAISNCLTSLSKQVALGIWIGKPHKTDIVAPKNIKDSLRVSRGTVRTSGNQRNQHRASKKKKIENISRAEFATQKVYVSELEMELDAMSRQVRGHGALEEMERSLQKKNESRRKYIAKKFHYLQNKLKTENEKKEILESVMSTTEEEKMLTKDLTAKQFHVIKESELLEKEMREVERLENIKKRDEIRLLNSFENVNKSLDKMKMDQKLGTLNSNGLFESRMKREVLRLGLAQTIRSGKQISLSPIKKQGKYLNGISGLPSQMNATLKNRKTSYDHPVLIKSRRN